MEELRSEDLEELMQELEEEGAEEERLTPEVEELLRDLQSDSHYFDREAAAEKLGKLDASNPRIVQALIVARKSDSHTVVRDAAARALRAPVHQAVLQEHPQVIQSAERMARDMQRAERVVGDMQPMETASLSPSELILLNGGKFARTSSAALKWGDTEWIRLVHIDADADAITLGVSMLAAAFLAVEQAGDVHLEVCRQQALFGLKRSDKLYVMPREHTTSWPEYSCESWLQPLAQRLESRGRNHVSEIVWNWMERDHRSPWTQVGNFVYAGLAARGLLETQRKAGIKGLLLGETYVLPAKTAAMATQQSLEPVRKLLATCEQTRPEVWDLLWKGITEGIGKCTERRDWD